MVPPAPDPDDAHPEHDDDWLAHIDVALRLRRFGLVMQINAVQDAAAGLLIAHVEDGPGPHLVLTEAGALGQAPEGSVVVLLKAGEWPHWLNQLRAVVNKRRLLLLLWCTDEDRVILKRQAPDFYDWISLRVTIPPTQPGYVLAALATASQDGGVLALHHTQSVPLRPPPGWTPLHLRAGYAALRAALLKGDVWLSGLTAADECLTALVAHAEAHAQGHAGALVLVDPSAMPTSMTAVDARPVPWSEAIATLTARGVAEPGLVAARADLNPRQIFDTVSTPATVIENPEWGVLLDAVRAGVGPETLALAERLGLVSVAAVWRGEGIVAHAPTIETPHVDSLAEQTRAWITEDKKLNHAERAALEPGLQALTHAVHNAYYSESARLNALGPTVQSYRSAAQDRGALAPIAAALAELIVLAAAWLPEDEEAQASALAALRSLNAEGVLPGSVWGAALLRRAERLLNAPKATDRRGEAQMVLDEAAALVGEGWARGQLLYLRGRLCHERGEYDEAIVWFQRAEDVHKTLGDQRRVTHLKSDQARALTEQGKLSEALALRETQELPLWRAVREEQRVASTQYKIADLKLRLGEADEAAALLTSEVLPVYERIGDVRGAALTRSRLADIFDIRGQLDEALRLRQEEVLPVLLRLGDALNAAITKRKIAEVLTARGQLDEALRIYREEVLPVFEQLGDGREKAITLTKIANTLESQGQRDEVLPLRREVLSTFEALSLRHPTVLSQISLALTLLRTGKVEQHPEAYTLLFTAFRSAIDWGYPSEAQRIRSIFRQLNLPPPTPS